MQERAGRREVSSVVRLPTLGVTVLLIVGACAVPQPLPTVEVFSGACRGVGLESHITGDPSDPRIAWLVQDVGGKRLDVIWPPGYKARFTPRLEVLDEKGAVAFHDGDPVTGGCTTGPDAQGPLLIAPGL